MIEKELEQFLKDEIQKMPLKQRAIIHLAALGSYVTALQTMLDEAEDELSSAEEEYKYLFEETNA